MKFVPSHTTVACNTLPIAPQESSFPHEPISDNVHEDPLRHESGSDDGTVDAH